MEFWAWVIIVIGTLPLRLALLFAVQACSPGTAVRWSTTARDSVRVLSSQASERRLMSEVVTCSTVYHLIGDGRALVIQSAFSCPTCNSLGVVLVRRM